MVSQPSIYSPENIFVWSLELRTSTYRAEKSGACQKHDVDVGDITIFLYIVDG